MGYFDSAKNQYLWNEELSVLVRQRDAFLKDGIDPYEVNPEEKTKEKSTANRILMTFEELEKEQDLEDAEERSVYSAVKQNRMETGQSAEIRQQAERNGNLARQPTPAKQRAVPG